MHVLSPGLQLTALLVGSFGILMTALALLAEFGFIGLVLGLVLGPITFFAMPLYALWTYGSPFLLLTNLVLPGLLVWAAGALAR